ncbi:MAG: spermidine synthase [Pirellulaceae bacterium]
MPLPRLALCLWFALTTLLSAFLVFQVQPVISKTVLPWFGGSPAVWTTCMLFFQVFLFAGYAYAHLLHTHLRLRWQGAVHFGLLAAALTMLPITPPDSWKPTGVEDPTWRILWILAANVGLPYFLLSATGPLLQAWFSQDQRTGSPYRLYALSNAGSLAALLSYPVVVEPQLSSTGQCQWWSLGFCVFAVLCGYLAARTWQRDDRGDRSVAPVESAAPPGWCRQTSWVLLPALASVMLLATTNHVCQDIAVIPFLWVAPLALYLVTFVVCFDRERWYVRPLFAALALMVILVVTCVASCRVNLPLIAEILLHFAALFFVCMVCHGELVRAKPAPRLLTKFYLCSSAGGALGGLLVALACPLLFDSYFELNLCLILGSIVAMGVLAFHLWDGFLQRPQRRVVGGLAYFAVLLVVGVVQSEQLPGNQIIAARNFYGTLKVDLNRSGQALGMVLLHGRIIHGFQFASPERLRFPTTYYSAESGVGRVLRYLRRDQPLRVGAVGLGIGTVSAYGRPGDYYRFYEINPSIVEVAKKTFAFLANCPAQIDIQMGDARLSLERETPQQLDVLVLDAFSGDSIPAHLLTQEAFALYRRHLKPDGVLAVHISNRHLRLEPVILRQAEHLGLQCVEVVNRGDAANAVLLSKWMLVTSNDPFLQQPEIASVARRFSKKPGTDLPLWTDRYNNLFQILSIF